MAPKPGVSTVRRGFTIVELLVTLTIMAALIGMLLPALGIAAAAGRKTECLSNLRQMAIAAQQYAWHNQYYPPAVRYENDGTVRIVSWDWVTTFDGTLISPGALWSFTDDPGKVQQCPEYHHGTNFGDPHTGYNYNTTFIGGEGRFPNFGWSNFRAGVRGSQCRRMATCAIFGCGGKAGSTDSTNKFMRAPLNTVERNLQMVYSGGQAFRHRKVTNVAYLDGHVTPVTAPQKGEHATDELLLTFMGYPSNGFLSNDDRSYDPR